MLSRFVPSTRPLRLAAVAGGALVTLATLAGCSTSGGSGAQPASAGNQSGASGTDAGTSFTDGSYTATGDYTSPGGPSAVEVTVRLKSGVVTAVKVVPKAENPTAQQYESQFSSGVSGQIVGKKISALNVTTVSGSSLTSQGFDKAVSDIEAKAKS